MARRPPPSQPELFLGPTDLEGYQPPVGGHHRAHTASEGPSFPELDNSRSLSAALDLAQEILTESRALVRSLRQRLPPPPEPGGDE